MNKPHSVEIGTTTPNSMLQVNGGVQIANDAVSCSAVKAGTLRYNGTSIQICSGSAWTTLMTSSSATASAIRTGWPDFLICNSTSPSWGTRYLQLGADNGVVEYHDAISGYFINYNQDGTFNSYGNFVTTNCNSSIATLISAGQAVFTASSQWAQNGGTLSTTAGNVGIGTTNPIASLELSLNSNNTNSVPTAASPKFLRITNSNTTDGNYSAISFGTLDTANMNGFAGVIGTQFTTHTPGFVGGDMFFATSSSGYSGFGERMRITGTGNIGIGTTAPDQRLVVYNGSTTGKYTTSGWTHSSDIRFKQDIAPLENSLDKILKLQGVEYKFKADPNHEKQIGFIAQHVEPVFPEVVKTDKEGFKSLVYSNLVAPLVESVKALYQRLVDIESYQANQAREIAELKARTNKAEADAAEMKARLDKIEKVLN